MDIEKIENIDELKKYAVAIYTNDIKAIELEKTIKKIANLSGISINSVKKELKALHREFEQQNRKTTIDAISGYRIPNGYFVDDSGVIYQEVKGGLSFVCEAFVVDEIQRTNDNKEGLFVFHFLNKNQRVTISTDDFVETKRLETILLNHGIYISGDSIKKFKIYTNFFLIANQDIIKTTILTASTGWQEINMPVSSDDGRVYIKRMLKYCNPILKPDLRYIDAIDRKIYKSGDIVDAINVLNNGLKWKGIAVSILAGLASTLIYPLRKDGLGNFVINFAGTTGKGKTLSARVGLSMFGNVSEGEDSLISNMDSTSVGNEIKFTTYKDMPILLDEAGTVRGNAETKARKVLDTIFQFFSGQGRSRGQKKLKLRNEFEARGVLFLTMEFDLQTIEKMANTQEKGYYRRTIEVFTDTDDFLAPREVYDFTVINKVFGHIHSIFISSIIEHFGAIREDYIKYIKELEHTSLRGKEKFFSVLYATLEHLFRIELITDSAYKRAKELLKTVYNENLEIMESVTEKADLKWIEKLIEFVSINEMRFFWEGKDNPANIKYGEIKTAKNNEVEIRIYPDVLDKFFLIENGINTRAFLKALADKGILLFEKRGTKRIYKVKRNGVRMYVFKKKQLLEYETDTTTEIIIKKTVKRIDNEKNDGNYIQFLGNIYNLDEEGIETKLKDALISVRDVKQRKSIGIELENILLDRGYTVVWENEIPVGVEEIPF